MSAEPASAAAPELEPKSPMWLPGLGAALFLAAGVWWMLTPPFGQGAGEIGPAAGKLAEGALRDAGAIAPIPENKRFPTGH